jgi:hypothetical protein
MRKIEWERGDIAVVDSDSFEDSGLHKGTKGTVVDVKSARIGGFLSTDIRVHWETGDESWVPAEDCTKYF